MKLFEFFGTILVKNEDAINSLQKTENKTQALTDKFLGMISGSSQLGSSIAGGFQKGSSALGDLGINLDAGMLAFGSFAVAGVAALAAVGSAIFDSANKFADYAGDIDDYAQKIGISTESYQRFGYAMKQSGLDINVMQGGMKKLLDTVVDADNGNEKAKNAFESLGVSIYDVNGKLKDNDTLMKDTIIGLANMPVGAERAALANDLLGKSATELAPLFNQGADGIENLMNRADELGLVFSNDAISAGAVFGDTMYDINASFDAVSNQMGLTFMPMMQGFLNWVLDNMPTIRGVCDKVFSAIGVSIQILTPIFDLLGKSVTFIFDVFGAVFGGLEAIVSPVVKVVIGFINGLIDAINVLTFGLLDLKKIGQDSADWMKSDSFIPKESIYNNEDGSTTEYSKYYTGEHYNGGIISPGYSGTVGENGIELLQNIGGKAVVTPIANSDSRNDNTNITINVDMNNIRDIQTLLELAKQAKLRTRMVG
ncbi:MAG: hypothetical protein RR738_04865 [Anaerorhabdus sp.]|uniref:hypothetical protein n=1 Tax=Anaerorhabdus sp. TaxID=1872524 RepID=UPI002FC63DDD